MLGRSIRWDITVELRKLRGRLRQRLSGERVMVVSDQAGQELARFTARGPHPSPEEDRWWEAHPELTDKVSVTEFMGGVRVFTLDVGGETIW